MSNHDNAWLMNLSGIDCCEIPKGVEESTLLEGFRTRYCQFRRLGQIVSPVIVLPALIANTHALKKLSVEASDSFKSELLALGAGFAEYTGWMAQESGNDRAALWWTVQAAGMAAAAGDRSLADAALVRRAQIALHREDASQTIGLARQAQVNNEVSTRIRGLAAQCEAQGHALACDYDACMRCLDRARELLSACSDNSTVFTLGSTGLSDPVSMITGWCLFELGRPKEASRILDVEVAQIEPHALRSRARYGVRQAMAHAAAGQLEQTCMVVNQLVEIIGIVDSATIAIDLRRLTRMLSRWHDDAAVRELYPKLIGLTNLAE